MSKSARRWCAMLLVLIGSAASGAAPAWSQETAQARRGLVRMVDEADVAGRLMQHVVDSGPHGAAVQRAIRSLLLGQYQYFVQHCPEVALRDFETAELLCGRAAADPAIAACPDCRTAFLLSHVLRGLALRDLNRPAEALSCLERAIELGGPLAGKQDADQVNTLLSLARATHAEILSDRRGAVVTAVRAD